MRTEHSFRELPQSYVLIADIDLQKNKKAFLIVNGMALLIIAIMVIPMLFIVPISTLFSFDYGLGRYALRFGVLLVAMILYIILHELTHAAVMRYYGAKKVQFGFTGLYAYAGSKDDY
ncbi:MAG: hypothetical protein J6B77_07785, partial [Clostridia bacterium]|nr:hypothetical protein [Clostridia bacterium]